MKITEAVKREESESLKKLRELVKNSPADTIYSDQELAAAIGRTRRHVHDLLAEPEFAENKVRDGRRFLYGSLKSIAAFEKARREL